MFLKKYCDCKNWYEEETDENSILDWDTIREYNYCPFCGQTLIDPRD